MCFTSLGGERWFDAWRQAHQNERDVGGSRTGPRSSGPSDCGPRPAGAGSWRVAVPHIVVPTDVRKAVLVGGRVMLSDKMGG